MSVNRLNATEGIVSNPPEVKAKIWADLGSMHVRWPYDAGLDHMDPGKQALRVVGDVEQPARSGTLSSLGVVGRGIRRKRVLRNHPFLTFGDLEKTVQHDRILEISPCSLCSNARST